MGNEAGVPSLGGGGKKEKREKKGKKKRRGEKEKKRSGQHRAQDEGSRGWVGDENGIGHTYVAHRHKGVKAREAKGKNERGKQSERDRG